MWRMMKRDVIPVTGGMVTTVGATTLMLMSRSINSLFDSADHGQVTDWFNGFALTLILSINYGITYSTLWIIQARCKPSRKRVLNSESMDTAFSEQLLINENEPPKYPSSGLQTVALTNISSKENHDSDALIAIIDQAIAEQDTKHTKSAPQASTVSLSPHRTTNSNPVQRVPRITKMSHVLGRCARFLKQHHLDSCSVYAYGAFSITTRMLLLYLSYGLTAQFAVKDTFPSLLDFDTQHPQWDKAALTALSLVGSAITIFYLLGLLFDKIVLSVPRCGSLFFGGTAIGPIYYSDNEVLTVSDFMKISQHEPVVVDHDAKLASSRSATPASHIEVEQPDSSDDPTIVREVTLRTS